MKAVILAGGLGTRITEETQWRPKPMIEIGGRPLLWHIMKLYAHHGINDFVILLGYKGYVAKEYFANYVLHSSDVTIDARQNRIDYHQSQAEPWRITLVDTGEATLTGGRLKRAQSFIEPDGTFCLTYGDGLSNVDLGALIAFHHANGRAATLTAVTPPARYGALDLHGAEVKRFIEKPPGDNALINGGFFVLEPSVFDLIEGDDSSWEDQPLASLAETGQLMAWRHRGFWQAMDTLRDKQSLEAQWATGKAPWKVWP